jgi:GNAT superfamily N-acetyltransferase
MLATIPITFLRTEPADADALATLRVEAMRESLERVGRFDEKRARSRLLVAFDPFATRSALRGEEKVGFFVLKAIEGGLLLDHLYVRPPSQKQGIGRAILAQCFAEADAAGSPIFVGALRESDANSFYERNGFVKTHETEWDVYYLRKPA